MQITKSSNTKTYLFIAFSLLFLVAFGLFVNRNNVSTKALVENKIVKENYPTEIPISSVSIEELIKTDQSYLYKNNDAFVFAVKEGHETKIKLVYEGPLSKREQKDILYIHVYLKDTTLLKTPFYNLTFEDPGIPEELDVDGDPYFVFSRSLRATFSDKGFIPFEDIKHISVGRFNRAKGRSFDAQKLIVETIKIEKSVPKIIAPEGASTIEILPLKTINAFAKESDFQKIKEKRNDALEKEILISGDNDYIKGDIAFENEERLNANFRLKGDWTDHLNGDNQWSYRFIIKDEKTLMGMRKFSIQHPKTRNYQWEWLFNKIVKDEGLIGLRYEFVYFNQHLKKEDNVEVIDNKIMAIEESFDKILIENNKSREGVIIAFDESMVWEDRQYGRSLGLDDYPFIGNRAYKENAKIKVYNENKVLSNPELKKQFLVAKDLLEGLRLEKYKISEVFDIDKLTTYVALCNVFGGQHGLAWHNLRIYYNPITNKLEPISFDSQGGYQIGEIVHYPFIADDQVYLAKLAKKIKLVSSQKYIDKIIKRYSLQLNQLNDVLYKVYPEYLFDIKILEYNSNVLKKLIFPINLVQADFISIENNTLSLEVNNLNNFPITLDKLIDPDGKTLNNNNTIAINLKPNQRKIVTITLKGAFDNAFVSKKSKKGGFSYPKDISKLRITGTIDGVGFTYTDKIGATATNKNLNEDIALYRNRHSINYSDFPFVTMGKDSTQLLFKKGSYVLTKDMKIAKGLSILIEPGFQLDFTNNASIFSKSAITALGTISEPITFTSTDSSGGGLLIDRTATTSTLTHCVFDNLSNPHSERWSVSGAVNFYESKVEIAKCIFKNNRCEDGLNIIRSDFTMTESQFYNTFSDSFDGDFVTGTISKCQFYNAGNDAIDISGSKLELLDILIENPLDKGISAGEASTITGNVIKIIDGEIGIVSKDLSQVELENVFIENTRLGFSAFQKKSEYGKATIAITKLSQIENEKNYLIETGCKLTIDNALMPTISNKVIEQMYGAEYGKSTK